MILIPLTSQRFAENVSETKMKIGLLLTIKLVFFNCALVLRIIGDLDSVEGRAGRHESNLFILFLLFL